MGDAINTEFGRLALFLGVQITMLVIFLVGGEVPVARNFTRIVSVRRRSSPWSYWLFMLLGLAFTAMIAWETALAGGLDDLMPPGMRVSVEKVAPFAAALTLATFIIAALSAEHRRRARLIGKLGSALQRTASGL